MNGKHVLLCSLINIRRWIIDKRIYMLVALMVGFHLLHFSGIYAYAASVGRGVTPWVFPHLFSHPWCCRYMDVS